MPHVCPYFDMERKKCKLYDTYQSDFAIKEYCLGPYWDSFKNCPNYIAKKNQ